MIHSQNVDGLVVMDAENGSLVAGDLFRWDLKVDNSRTVIQPNGSTWDRTLEGTATYQFELASSGMFVVALRCDGGGADAKVRVEIDGAQNALGIRNEGILYYTHRSGYVWSLSNGNAEVFLAAGPHTITLRSLRKELRVDRLALIPVGSSVIIDQSSAIGPDHTGGTTFVDDPVTEGFSDWLANPVNNGTRTLLVELDHAQGMVTLASRAWMSETNVAYDDWLIAEPVIEDLLQDLSAVGDISAACPDLSTDWTALYFRGYECRVLLGDVSWKRSEFKLLARARIDGVREVARREYIFDLSSAIQDLGQSYHSGNDVSVEKSALDAVRDIVGKLASVPRVEFQGLEENELAKIVKYTLTDSNSAFDDLVSIAESLRAFVRLAPDGALEIVRPDDAPVVTITENDVERGSVQIADSLPATASVQVAYNESADTVEQSTSASTGLYNEAAEYETVLRDQADAEEYAQFRAAERSRQRDNWELSTVGLDAFLREGDVVETDLPQIQGLAVVRRRKFAPLGGGSVIEVRP